MKRPTFICLVLMLMSVSVSAAQQSADEMELLRIHEEVLESHRRGDVERWMALESEEYLSVNGGRVTLSSSDDRRQARGPYLASTTFTMYEDLRPPIVRISDDGSLGWLIAEVKVRGVQRGQGGEETSLQAIWAWVELYEKSPEGWRIVGNASNPRVEDDQR